MPLSITDIGCLRANSAPLPMSVSPFVCSDSFKSPHTREKPTSKPLDHHFSNKSRGFGGSSMKKPACSTGNHKLIALGTGRPTADYYPWEFLIFQGIPPRPHYDAKDGIPAETVTKSDNTYNLSLALNYGHAAGSPPLVRFVTEHMEMVHNPPYADWQVCLTCGSTAAFETALRIFCNPGDTFLTEQFTYPGALAAAMLVGIKAQGIAMDAEGPKPDDLERILSTWDDSIGKRPTVFYTIPSGQNPTGVTQPLQRKREIYDIAEKYDLLIIEDDPYYFLRLVESPKPDNIDGKAGIDESQERPWGIPLNLVPSYLSLDRSGRVVRLDSISKIVAPGLRAGWVTASAHIIDKFMAYQEVTTVAVSGPSQLMLWKLLDESWGHDGFFSWLGYLSEKYRARMKIFIEACDRYLPKTICDWELPGYGMFLWIKVDWTQHPSLQKQVLLTEGVEKYISDLEESVARLVLSNGAQITKGSLFHYDRKHDRELHFRLTFVAASEDVLEEGVRIFANAIREVFKLAG